MERDIDTILRESSEADSIRLSGMGVQGTLPDPRVTALMDLHQIHIQRIYQRHADELTHAANAYDSLLKKLEKVKQSEGNGWAAAKRWMRQAQTARTHMGLALFALGCVAMWAFCQGRG